MRVRLRAAVTVLAMTGAALAVPATANAAAAPPIDWKPCPGLSDVDCGTVTVPLDWDRPHGATTTIALARRKALDPAARLGSLVFDPGGPGGSGVDVVANVPELFSQEVRKHYDIVGFDPRGVGASNPIQCDLDVLSEQVPPVPMSPADLETLRAHNHRLGTSCHKLTGPLYNHVDTTAVAHDMDAIRAALGDKKLNYYGVSYGTLMGEQYAELFPHHVGRMVLDSNMDHSQRTTFQFMASETASSEDSFREFAAWCDRTAACALHGQNVGAVFDDLYAKATRGELTFPGDPNGTKIDPFTLLGIAFGSFYGPDWAGLARFLAVLENQTPPTAADRTMLAFGQAVPEAFETVFCEDWRLPVHSFAELNVFRLILAQIAPHMRLSPLGWQAPLVCQNYPAPVNNPQHPLRAKGAPPILMINALHDPATPYTWAVAAHSQLSSSVLLTYEGWGHAEYWKSPCVSGAADTYLVTGTTPAPDARCPGVEPPSGPPSALRAQPARPGVPVGPSGRVPGWF